MEQDILFRFTLNDKAEITNTGKEIGRGAYGRVFKVDYYGTLCAAKEIHSVLLEGISHKDLQITKQIYLRECCQCCALRHPNIVQFLGLYWPPSGSHAGSADTELPIIVMELMQESLRSYIESAEENNITIAYLAKLSILQDVAQGLRYLHHQNPPVVHRDLSPNNILLTAHLVAKISDLGVAKAVKIDHKCTMTKVPGTVSFMPPEALEESSKYGPPLDVFSYGGVTLYMISQEWPMLLPVKRFDQNLNRSVFLTEVERRQKYVDKMIDNAEEIRPLVLSCLDENPVMRPAIATVLERVKEIKCCYQAKDQARQSQQFMSFTQCKSDGCLSEVVQGYDGYCSRCYPNHLSTQEEASTLLTGEKFFRQKQSEEVQHDDVYKHIKQADEPSNIEEEYAVYTTPRLYPKTYEPPSKTVQQQQQQQVPSKQRRPQIKPRKNLKTPDIYDYLSSKEVQPAIESNYTDSIYVKPRPDSSSSLPSRPPILPRYSVQSAKINEHNITGDDDMDYYYVPRLLNQKKINSRDESLDYPLCPPLPPKRNNSSQSSEKFYADFLQYFSPEQMQQLVNMFKEVAGVQERGSPQQLQKQLSSSDVVSALRKTSQNLPDQILSKEAQYVIGEDDSTKKWARANSIPHGKRLDKLAEDINDPIHQMQKEAFTIQKEALSNFRVIGRGQYGVVEAALYTPSPGATPIKVAIKKTMQTCSQLDKDNFYKEIVVMAQFMHPNIVRVFGSVDKGVTSSWLVLEFLSNGDLKSFLKCNNRPVHRLVKYMVDIAMGMHYLSEKGFVHRDLAARNIFLDENELCKVGDFGLLRETTSRDDGDEGKHYIMQSELALPVRWMAVECLTKQIFSSASDVWSFGVLMWELFNPLVRPYMTMDNMTVIAAVSAGRRLNIPEKCPMKVGQVMQACWNADQTKRPSFLVIANLLCRYIQQETPSRK